MDVAYISNNFTNLKIHKVKLLCLHIKCKNVHKSCTYLFIQYKKIRLIIIYCLFIMDTYIGTYIALLFYILLNKRGII